MAAIFFSDIVDGCEINGWKETVACPGTLVTQAELLCSKYLVIRVFLFLAVNGCWTEWTDATQCYDCGNQIKSQFRNCTNPEPEAGGHDCPGENMRNVKCPYLGECKGDQLNYED